MIDDDIVPILSAQPMIAIGRDHFDAVALDPHDRDVERSAAKVENENGLIFIQFVEAVGQRRGGRLVDDLQDVEARELTGGDRRGSLRIIEISRHRDDRIGDRFLEIFLRVEL